MNVNQTNSNQLVDEKVLCSILCISRSSCWRLRKSGKLADATFIVGTRGVRYDVKKVLDALRETNSMPWSVKQKMSYEN